MAKRSLQDNMVQVTLRMPEEQVKRLEDVGKKLGLDRSSLLRLITAEKLPEYEDRARQTAADGRKDHR